MPSNKPIVQAMENPPKVLAPKPPKAQDKVIPIRSYATPQMKHRGDASSRKTIQDVSREIPIYPDPVYQSPPKPVKIPIPKIPGSLSDSDSEPNTDFEEKFSTSRGCNLENVPKTR